ncbi:MAG: transcriptional regulator [Flavobacterium sp.]|uniref:DUF6377 domain-containing protein n=1 Tax=Flavobacterium sp. TaxID=239 RepID=UPI00120DA9C9|nr:DUF6377 domain-containing protein [Flavobacterium sp.]RZJ68488.1 MAG: transcriptional regulator [Flavobacterium sp.]
MRFWVVVFAFFISGLAVSQTQTDSLLLVLETTMKSRKTYDDARQKRIASLKQLLSTPRISSEQVYEINDKLITEFVPYQFDSAVKYLNENLEIATKLQNEFKVNETKTRLGGLLSSSGNYVEAVEMLRSVNAKKLERASLLEYYNFMMEVYARLGFYSPVEQNKSRYNQLFNGYADTLLSILPKTSERYLFINERRARENGDIETSLKSNDLRLNMARIGTRDYSRATFGRSLIYQKQNDLENRKRYLILSAISDIRGSVKDNAAMADLAMILFEEDDIERAHRFIDFSFADADFYNSRLRLIAISNILPIINKTYEQKNEQQRLELRNYLWLISALGLILLVAIVMIYREIRKVSKARNELQHANEKLRVLNENLQRANTQMSQLHGELRESNQVKEHYIGNFLNICSDYIDKLDNYRKTVKKMLLAKQTSELFQKTNSDDFIQSELEAFYHSFDSAFLHIYPDFVAELNALLSSGEQVFPKKGELLNTELRIFALIRLGISDSATIARLLRYSVNTIYNYRVKMKNKAVSREDFEQRVSKIGSFS